LIEGACFSPLSAVSRSPTISFGSRWHLMVVGDDLVEGRFHGEEPELAQGGKDLGTLY
jgi:hypothetical protein